MAANGCNMHLQGTIGFFFYYSGFELALCGFFTMAWEVAQDDQGRSYYYNTETQETSWTSPDDAWQVYTNDDGREYYYNDVTQETTWERPLALDGGEANGAEPLAESAAAEPLAATEPLATAELPESTAAAEPLAAATEPTATEPAATEPLAATEPSPAIDAALRHEPIRKSDLLISPSPAPHQAHAAFKAMLESANVDSTWSFQKVMTTFITNPTYWCVADALERKNLYDEYLTDRIKLQVTNKLAVVETFEADFAALLTLWHRQGRIRHNTRWLSVRKQLVNEDNSLYRHAILSEGEIQKVYAKFVAQLQEEHDSALATQRQQALAELRAYLVDINPQLVQEATANGGGWQQLHAKLTSDPRYQANKHFAVLQPVDILGLYRDTIFPQTLAVLEKQIDHHNRTNRRHDRHARAQFKQLLGRTKINANTLFKEVFAQWESEDAFIELCGRNGSTPLEYFWDVVDAKAQTMKLKRDLVESELRRVHKYRVLARPEFDEVVKRLTNDVVRHLASDEATEVFESLQREWQLQKERFERQLAQAVDNCSRWLAEEYAGLPDALVRVAAQPEPGVITFVGEPGAYKVVHQEMVPALIDQCSKAAPVARLRHLLAQNVPEEQVEERLAAAVEKALQQLATRVDPRQGKKRALEPEARKEPEAPRKKPVLLNY